MTWAGVTRPQARAVSKTSDVRHYTQPIGCWHRLAPGHFEGCDRAGGVEQLEVRENQNADGMGHGCKRGKKVISDGPYSR